MTARLVVHCGMTKTGSTSIQLGLRSAVSSLADVGVTSIVDSRDSASREIYLPDSYELLESLRPDSESISVNSFFYQYRLRRANAGTNSARQLLEGLAEAVRARVETSDVIVVSGEALEGCLANRDALFAQMLQELSTSINVELAVFARPIEEHVLSSWQEFSWSSGTPLDVWLARYRDRTSPTAFWSDLSAPYYASLARFEEWIPFWQQTGLDLRVVPTSIIPNRDSVAYFFDQFLGASGLAPVGNNSKSSWPPNLLRVLPRLSAGFNGDYERFRQARNVLAEYPLDPEEGESLRRAALQLIRSALSPHLYESTRRSEHLLGVPEGALGIDSLSGETELEALNNLREWQQPTTIEWVNLSYALLGHALFRPTPPASQPQIGMGDTTVAVPPAAVSVSMIEPPASDLVTLEDGLLFRNPLFNLPVSRYDNRWELLTDIIQKWFETQERPFHQDNRCRILEIGVWKAWNVTPFFKRFGPVFDFIGLDPYGELVDDPYKGQFWESDSEAEAVYQEALAKFEAEGATLLRTTSDDYFAQEDVGLFDIIFVDGDHRFPQATRDLNAGLDHLRPGGLLMCDDVANNFHPEVEWAVRGFYKARNDDIAAYGAHPLFFQLDAMPFPVMLMIGTFLKR